MAYAAAAEKKKCKPYFLYADMIYATVTDYYGAYPQEEGVDLTTLDDPTALLPNNQRIEYWLKGASSTIRGELGLPDDSQVSLGIFKEWCIDIARYKMDSYNAREDVRQRYEDAIEAIRAMRKENVIDNILYGDTTKDEIKNTPIMSIFCI